MSIIKRRTASMFVASSILYAAQVAAAGESGSFSYVASLVYDYTTLEHAEQTFTGGPAARDGHRDREQRRPLRGGAAQRRDVFRLLQEVGCRAGSGNPLHEHRCLG